MSTSACPSSWTNTPKYWITSSTTNPMARDFPVRPNSFDRTLCTKARTPETATNNDKRTKGFVSTHRSPWSCSQWTTRPGLLNSTPSVVTNWRSRRPSEGSMARFSIASTFVYR